MKNIFKSLDKEFILNSFKKNNLFKDKEISKLEIKKISPDWAKESCLVRYKIIFKDSEENIIRGTAKLDFSRKKVWETMQMIYSLDFNNGKLLSPKPLLYSEDINLLLYEEAKGTPLVNIIENKEKNIKKAIIFSAKWLSKLHLLPIDNFKKATFIGKDNYLKIFNDIAKKERSILKEIPSSNILNLIEKEWKKGESVVIHNDFYPGNAIFEKDIFYGIDFDKTGKGPFLMDIATIYAALNFPKIAWKSKLEKEESNNLWNIFINTYSKERNIDFLNYKDSFRVFKMKVFLDQACYFSSFASKGWKEINKKTKKGIVSKIKTFLRKVKSI